MKRGLLFPLILSILFISGCTIVRNLQPGAAPRANEGVAFARFIIRFEGTISQLYRTVLFHFYDASVPIGKDSKPVKSICVEEGKHVEGLILKPGKYRLARYLSGNYSGLLVSGTRDFTVESGKINYIGTIFFSLSSNSHKPKIGYVTGKRPYTQARNGFHDRFPVLAGRYPFRMAFQEPKNSPYDGELDEGRW